MIAYRRFDERLPPEMQQAPGLEAAWRERGTAGYWDYLRRQETAIGNLYGAAIACASVGDANAAFELLEKAYAGNDAGMALLLTAPLEALHEDPRFADLARRMNLPVPVDVVTG